MIAEQTAEQWKQRDVRFEPTMSAEEALMWRVETDPWLAPSGGMVIITDTPVDIEMFRRRIAYAITQLPRLRERVIEPSSPLARPEWQTDRDFDLDYHLRHVALPAPGERRQLFDLAIRLLDDPYDRSRPLWMFTVVDGLADGRGAVFGKLHHAVSDGTGAIRLAEMFMELEPDAPQPPDVDLDEVIRADLDAAATRDGDAVGALVAAAVKAPLGLARAVAGEVALSLADPQHAVEAGTGAVESLAGAIGELTGGDGGEGSPLFGQRSRRRQLEGLRVPLEDAKAAAKALGGTINDLFVTAVAEGTARYHARHEAANSALNLSFVVSTRHDDEAGGNAFTPTMVRMPPGRHTLRGRFEILRGHMADKRAAMEEGGNPLATVAGLAAALPTSAITRVARDSARRVDIATSNFRAAPFTVYISGARIVENYTLGPVMGTAGNITLMSYDGSLDIGMVFDPAAVAHPGELRDDIAAAFHDLLAEAPASDPPTRP